MMRSKPTWKPRKKKGGGEEGELLANVRLSKSANKVVNCDAGIRSGEWAENSAGGQKKWGIFATEVRGKGLSYVSGQEKRTPGVMRRARKRAFRG